MQGVDAYSPAWHSGHSEHTRLLTGVQAVVSYVSPGTHGVQAEHVRSIEALGAVVWYVSPAMHSRLHGVQLAASPPAAQVPERYGKVNQDRHLGHNLIVRLGAMT